MTDFISSDVLTTLAQVVMIDLVLAGDNAVVIALAAAGLPDKQRRRAILIGIITATILRIVGATIATQLLQVLGLLLAGGILLLWVCWKMWRELRTTSRDQREADEMLVDSDPRHDGTVSLDNVLAVAGAAREHPFILAFGLLLSVTLMGIGANVVGRLLQKHRWMAYFGLAIILYVACEMIYRGAHELKPVIGAIGLIFS